MRSFIVLLSLAGLAGFSWLSWDSLQERVAESLTATAQAVLNDHGFDKMTVSFTQLDGIVTGAETREQQEEVFTLLLETLPTGRIIFEASDNLPEQAIASKGKTAARRNFPSSENSGLEPDVEPSTDALVITEYSDAVPEDVLINAAVVSSEPDKDGSAELPQNDVITDTAEWIDEPHEIFESHALDAAPEDVRSQSTVDEPDIINSEFDELATTDLAPSTGGLATNDAWEGSTVIESPETSLLTDPPGSTRTRAANKELYPTPISNGEIERAAGNALSAARVHGPSTTSDMPAANHLTDVAAFETTRSVPIEFNAPVPGAQISGPHFADAPVIQSTKTIASHKPTKSVLVTRPAKVVAPVKPKAKSPRLGVYLTTSPNDPVVRHIDIGSAADLAGIRIGDSIVRFGRRNVTGYVELANAVLQYGVGDRVEVLVKRDGNLLRRTVKLLEADANVDDTAIVDPPTNTESIN